MPDTRPTPAQAISKTLNRLKARGPGEVADLARERAKGWISSGDTLVVFVRDSGSMSADGPGLTFREATDADADRYARDIGTDSAVSFRARLSPRTHCFVVDDGNHFLHASWVTSAGAWTRELRRYLVPPPGDVYVYESFTRAEARGRGIYPFALRNIVTWGVGAGVQRVWVAVEEHNVPSIRAVTKAGFAEAFRLTFARRWGRLRLSDPFGPDVSKAAGFLSRNAPS